MLKKDLDLVIIGGGIIGLATANDILKRNPNLKIMVIEKNSSVELLAIGIGHDVTRYYDKAIKIADVQDLGDVMINQLTDLFSEKKKTIH